MPGIVERGFMEYAEDSFFGWVATWDTSGREEHYSRLQDYLTDWLEHGDAVEYSGGNFETFMRVMVHVIDAYFKDPSLLDYQGEDGTRRERRVAGVLDESTVGYWCMDKHYYEVVAHRTDAARQMGLRPEPAQSLDTQRERQQREASDQS